jgi:hypothetical protein
VWGIQEVDDKYVNYFERIYNRTIFSLSDFDAFTIWIVCVGGVGMCVYVHYWVYNPVSKEYSLKLNDSCN